VSRREIRRMLLEPKRRLTDRGWVAPALMVAVLLGGVGIGIAVGIGILASQPETKARNAWEQAEMAVDRPARREDGPAALDEVSPPASAGLEVPPPPPPKSPFHPVVPVPLPRPGGAADDGFDPAEAAPPEPPQVAAVPLILPQPPVRPIQLDSPAWLRHAVAAPRTTGQPVIAVVIDDLGVDRRRSEKVVTLRPPLTLAWMTYADNLPQITAQARHRGHELMLHVPMQPQAESYDPGPDVLETSLHPEEIRRRLVWGLNRFDGFVGINNHMGSRFTADRTGMRVVMEELSKRGLLFLDSVTTDKSVGPEMAKRFGVPFAVRHVFLDNDQNVAAVRAQLAKAEAHARKHGSAIAIGHPYDVTIEALAGWLPSLDGKGIVLVPVTAILKANGQN
jgi:polysaccharide deacetylase 2 family uncharacterized protein YibQ